MSPFMRGWRHKTGVLLLVFVSVLVTGWLRGQVLRDQVSIWREEAFHGIASSSGTIRWAKITPPPKDATEQKAWKSSMITEEDDHNHYWRHWNSEWRLGFAGFDFGAGTHRVIKNCRIERWAVPYWSCTLPLILLSVWLLVSKQPPKAIAIPSASTDATAN